MIAAANNASFGGKSANATLVHPALQRTSRPTPKPAMKPLHHPAMRISSQPNLQEAAKLGGHQQLSLATQQLDTQPAGTSAVQPVLQTTPQPGNPQKTIFARLLVSLKAKVPGMTPQQLHKYVVSKYGTEVFRRISQAPSSSSPSPLPSASAPAKRKIGEAVVEEGPPQGPATKKAKVDDEVQVAPPADNAPLPPSPSLSGEGEPYIPPPGHVALELDGPPDPKNDKVKPYEVKVSWEWTWYKYKYYNIVHYKYWDNYYPEVVYKLPVDFEPYQPNYYWLPHPESAEWKAKFKN